VLRRSHPRGEIDARLHDFASGDAQIVPLEMDTRYPRLLCLRLHLDPLFILESNPVITERAEVT
jgi:hypothetical protein